MYTVYKMRQICVEYYFRVISASVKLKPEFFFFSGLYDLWQTYFSEFHCPFLNHKDDAFISSFLLIYAMWVRSWGISGEDLFRVLLRKNKVAFLIMLCCDYRNYLTTEKNWILVGLFCFLFLEETF